MISTRQNPLKASDVTFCGLVCLAGVAVTFLVLVLFLGSEQRTVSVAVQNRWRRVCIDLPG